MLKEIVITTSVLLLFIFSSCNSENDKNNKDNNKGSSFRSGDLFTEDVNLGEKSVNTSNAPGYNKTVERAFENAPPLIPHKTEGFFPITLENNICLSCHMPDKAEKVGSTPMPESHFMKFRPEIEKEGSKYVLYEESDKVTLKNLNGKLSSAIYNCDQCHVPLTNATLVVKNTFEPEFRDETDKSKSTITKKIEEGIK